MELNLFDQLSRLLALQLIPGHGILRRNKVYNQKIVNKHFKSYEKSSRFVGFDIFPALTTLKPESLSYV